MPDNNRKNIFLEDVESSKSYPLDFDFIANPRKNLEPELKSEEDSGEEGEGSGSIALSVEQLNAYLLACFKKECRQWLKKFGSVPFTEDPNSLLGKKRHTGSICGELPHAHPLLVLSQQFSGDDPKITGNPAENSKASERYLELRNENQLRKNPELGRRKSVTLSR